MTTSIAKKICTTTTFLIWFVLMLTVCILGSIYLAKDTQPDEILGLAIAYLVLLWVLFGLGVCTNLVRLITVCFDADTGSDDKNPLSKCIASLTGCAFCGFLVISIIVTAIIFDISPTMRTTYMNFMAVYSIFFWILISFSLFTTLLYMCFICCFASTSISNDIETGRPSKTPAQIREEESERNRNENLQRQREADKTKEKEKEAKGGENLYPVSVDDATAEQV